jgi:hypothetical protein
MHAKILVDTQVVAGQVLTGEGAPGRQAFIIVDGQAVVSISGRPIATVGPGQMAVIDPEPRAATLTAVTPLRVLVLDPASLNSLLGPPVGHSQGAACGRRAAATRPCGSREAQPTDLPTGTGL